MDGQPHFVRPYLVTQGRARPSQQLDSMSHIAGVAGVDVGRLRPDHAEVVAWCTAEARAITEVAALMRQPTGTIKILVADLLDAGAIDIDDAPLAPVGEDVLMRLLDGLEKV